MGAYYKLWVILPQLRQPYLYVKLIYDIMRKNTVVSVIIPSKNEEKNILRCLRSIKAQKPNIDAEIILVDNNSSNNPVENVLIL